METIRGLTNWRLTLRREADHIVILRALSCDRRAALPETIFDLPVTALADRALAHGAKPVEGEELLILGGAEEGEWDNRNIEELSLPKTLQHVGDYAFMNLRAMETLRLYDSLLTTGSAGFMNCRAFSRVELTRLSPAQGPALASIVRSLMRELDVTVHNADGSAARLLFPEYLEDFTENRPAHYFEMRIVGGGYPYRQVFRDKALSIKDYDALWPGYLAGEHEPDSALRLAYYRLRCPVELSGRAREGYEDYLRLHRAGALRLCLREKDIPGLRLVLDLGDPDAAALDEALNEARALRQPEATALLLERKHKAGGGGRGRKFEI